MKYRVCLDKSTGRLLEMQSGGDVTHLETLRQNALNMGFSEDQIEVKLITEDEWKAIELASRPTPSRTQKVSLEASKQGIDDHKILMALFKKVMQNDSSDADAILASLNEIEKHV